MVSLLVIPNLVAHAYFILFCVSLFDTRVAHNSAPCVGLKKYEYLASFLVKKLKAHSLLRYRLHRMRKLWQLKIYIDKQSAVASHAIGQT